MQHRQARMQSFKECRVMWEEEEEKDGLDETNIFGILPQLSEKM